jgi:hypothetical protein
MRELTVAEKFGAHSKLWSTKSSSDWREASLNWLALGLLLAAWNAADNDAGEPGRRPETLRGYPYVSVRAAVRVGAVTDR